MDIKNYIFANTTFNADFIDKVNLMIDDSGTGKTFLIKMVINYCRNNNIPYLHIDYEHRDLLNDVGNLNSKEILLFDKADLYLTKELFEEIKNLKPISIISIKNIKGYKVKNNVGKYRLINTGENIDVEKWW